MNRIKRRASAASTGRVLMWEGGSVWISRDTGLVQPHAHHAMQIVLAPHAAIGVRGSENDDWLLTREAIVMADRPHQFDGRGQDVVIIFVEPETIAGRTLAARHGDTGVAVIDEPCCRIEASDLLAACFAGASDDALTAQAKHLVSSLSTCANTTSATDARITRALEWMRHHLDTPMTLAQVAAVVHLSPGRFRHLFVAQTGISFRAYLLWARVNHAVVLALAGESWTSAAQRAGFADSAHLTRTFRRMFGFAPTMLGQVE